MWCNEMLRCVQTTAKKLRARGAARCGAVRFGAVRCARAKVTTKVCVCVCVCVWVLLEREGRDWTLAMSCLATALKSIFLRRTSRLASAMRKHDPRSPEHTCCKLQVARHPSHLG